MLEFPYIILHVATGRRFACRVQCNSLDALLTLLNAWNRDGAGRWVYWSENLYQSPAKVPHVIVDRSRPQLELEI